MFIFQSQNSGGLGSRRKVVNKIIKGEKTKEINLIYKDNTITLNNETYTCQDASCSTNGMHKFVLKNKYGEIIKTIRAVIENNKLNLSPKTPTN